MIRGTGRAGTAAPVRNARAGDRGIGDIGDRPGWRRHEKSSDLKMFSLIPADDEDDHRSGSAPLGIRAKTAYPVRQAGLPARSSPFDRPPCVRTLGNPLEARSMRGSTAPHVHQASISHASTGRISTGYGRRWPGSADRLPLRRDRRPVTPAKRNTGIPSRRAIALFGFIRVVDRTGTVPYANNLVRKRSRSFRPSSENGGKSAVSFTGSLGDSLTVEQWTLTPLVEVRILVPQPLSHLSHSDH